MTVEVVKLIKKADVKIKVPQCIPATGEIIGYEEKYPFPKFNYYQQIELLKVLIEGRWIEFAHYRKGDLDNSYYYAGKVDFKSHTESKSFEDVIAGLINLMWENLNNTDKQRVKDIIGGELC